MVLDSDVCEDIPDNIVSPDTSKVETPVLGMLEAGDWSVEKLDSSNCEDIPDDIVSPDDSNVETPLLGILEAGDWSVEKLDSVDCEDIVVDIMTILSDDESSKELDDRSADETRDSVVSRDILFISIWEVDISVVWNVPLSVGCEGDGKISVELEAEDALGDRSTNIPDSAKSNDRINS